MTHQTATLVLTLFGTYLAIGLLFAFPFALKGARVIDPAARSMTWGAKLLIIPGAAALWPLLLRRWLRCQGPPVS